MGHQEEQPTPEELRRIERDIYVALAKGGSSWQTPSMIRAEMPRVPVAVITRYLDRLVDEGRAWHRGESGRRSYRLVS